MIHLQWRPCLRSYGQAPSPRRPLTGSANICRKKEATRTSERSLRYFQTAPRNQVRSKRRARWRSPRGEGEPAATFGCEHSASALAISKKPPPLRGDARQRRMRERLPLRAQDARFQPQLLRKLRKIIESAQPFSSKMHRRFHRRCTPIFMTVHTQGAVLLAHARVDSGV